MDDSIEHIEMDVNFGSIPRTEIISSTIEEIDNEEEEPEMDFANFDFELVDEVGASDDEVEDSSTVSERGGIL